MREPVGNCRAGSFSSGNRLEDSPCVAGLAEAGLGIEKIQIPEVSDAGSNEPAVEHHRRIVVSRHDSGRRYRGRSGRKRTERHVGDARGARGNHPLSVWNQSASKSHAAHTVERARLDR